MAEKPILKTKTGRRALRLIRQTPWAFTPEGLQRGLHIHAPSSTVKMTEINTIIKELLANETLIKFNGNGYRLAKPALTTDMVRKAIQLSPTSLHESDLIALFASKSKANTEEQIKKSTEQRTELMDILDTLAGEGHIKKSHKSYISATPMSNVAWVKIARTGKYGFPENWEDVSVPPYIQLHKKFMDTLDAEASRADFARTQHLMRFDRSARVSLGAKELLRSGHITGVFKTAADGTQNFAPTDYRIKGAFELLANKAAILPTDGQVIMARPPVKGSLSPMKLEIETVIPGEADYRTIDLYSNGVRTDIPLDAYQEAKDLIAAGLPKAGKLFQGRTLRDLRHKSFFSIDPVNRQDIDDAMHFERNEDGSLTASIAISYASALIPPGGALDTYRQQNPMAIFLPDGSRHTLPHILHNPDNGFLSLCENAERLALVYECHILAGCNDIDDIDYSIFPALIKSRQAFDYDTFMNELMSIERECPEAVSKGVDNAYDFYQRMTEMMSVLHFKSVKPSFSFNHAGNVTQFQARDPNVADDIVEFAMRLTNHIGFRQIQEAGYEDTPVIYRSQQAPDKDEILETLAHIEEIFPRSVPYHAYEQLQDAHMDDRDYRDIVHEAINQTLFNVPQGASYAYASHQLLKATRPGYYTDRALPHFALGNATLQQTSPLRRWHDGINQQVVAHAAGFHPNLPDLDALACSKAAQNITQIEGMAKDIERTSAQRHRIALMADKGYDTPFQGTIIEIKPRGIVIETEDKVRGLLPLSMLPRNWSVDHTKQSLTVAEDKTRIYGLGDYLPAQLWLHEACPLTNSLVMNVNPNHLAQAKSYEKTRSFT